MRLEHTTDVLVVGAGPVGMLSALHLSQAGIKVAIVDKAEGTATQDYACALHAKSLQLLAEVGLIKAILENGRRIDQVAIYEGENRLTEIPLSCLDGEHPYVVTFPQRHLETLLEQQLATLGKVKVHWTHRFSTLHQSGPSVVATVDQLEETSKGYIVPEWEWAVRKSHETKASFLVGTDGPNSHVRQVLNLKSDLIQPARRVAVFEFTPEGSAPDEMCLVLSENATSAYWPMPDGLCRWSFELADQEPSEEFPAKETLGLNVEHIREDEERIKTLRRLISERAPWFKAGIKDLVWAGEIAFQKRLAHSFGLGRCWLAGDAAHQTSPFAMQSLNAGLIEGVELTTILRRILQEKASPDLLDNYGQTQRNEWLRVMQETPQFIPGAAIPDWLRKHAGRLPAILPARGTDLNKLLKGIGLHFA